MKPQCMRDYDDGNIDHTKIRETLTLSKKILKFVNESKCLSENHLKI